MPRESLKTGLTPDQIRRIQAKDSIYSAPRNVTDIPYLQSNINNPKSDVSEFSEDYIETQFTKSENN